MASMQLFYVSKGLVIRRDEVDRVFEECHFTWVLEDTKADCKSEGTVGLRLLVYIDDILVMAETEILAIGSTQQLSWRTWGA